MTVWSDRAAVAAPETRVTQLLLRHAWSDSCGDCAESQRPCRRPPPAGSAPAPGCGRLALAANALARPFARKQLAARQAPSGLAVRVAVGFWILAVCWHEIASLRESTGPSSRARGPYKSSAAWPRASGGWQSSSGFSAVAPVCAEYSGSQALLGEARPIC